MRILLDICVLILVWSCISCERAPESPAGSKALPSSDSGPVLAVVGDRKITTADFEQELESRSLHSGRRYDTPAKQRALLDEMVRFQVLLSQAKRAGLDQDPDLRKTYEQMLVSRFQEQQIRERGIDKVIVSEQEARAYYDAHLDEFALPAQRRVGVLVRECSSKATPERREQLRQGTQALWREAASGGLETFRALVAKYSDDQATRYTGGDCGWMPEDQLGARLPSKVAAAAAALSTPGQLAPLVETADGFYIIKLLDLRPAGRRAFARVREGIAYRLTQEKRERLRLAFYEEMRTNLAVEVHPEVLDQVRVPVVEAGLSNPPGLPH